MRPAAVLAAVLAIAACTTTADPGSTTQAGDANTATGADESPSPVAESDSDMGCWSTEPFGGGGDIRFADTTEASGLVGPLTGMHGHTAIWTDVDGDDRPDLFVGSFADRPDEIYQQRGAEGPSPDRLLVAGEGGFSIDGSLPEMFSRSSGGVSVDLDNDADLDLIVARNIKDSSLGRPPTQIFENDNGRLRLVEGSGMPDELGGRSVGVLDYDGDGLLDLFIAEDRWTGGSSVLLHNDRGLIFSDATTDAGIPGDVHGLGVAVADFDGDTFPDIFVSGSNRLFLSDGPGRFEEADSTVFQWELFGAEDDVAGVSVADVNRDGLLDIAIGHHFNSTIDEGTTVSVRLYLNEGEGEFIDVTEDAGLTPLPTKAPHVELNDFDNDGWPDLLTSASAGEIPALFVHEGLDGDVPRFTTPEGLGDPQYWVAAPAVDYDRDGRLDVFLLEWEPALPSLLLRNETEAGNWLQVSVDAENGYGIGWRVEVFDEESLIGARDINVTQGYSAGALPIAHFGLGIAGTVDVRLTPPGDEESIVLGSIAANQHIRWPNGCG